MMRGAAIGLGALFTGGSLAKGMITFNAKVEDAKIQIAGMLALAKKTDVADQVGTANALYENLRKQAAELPGQTEDYINMLGFLVQPMAKAGASMAQMEELTVNAMIASRGLKESWQVAGRDISEFINFGKVNLVDKFLRRMIESTGIVVDDAFKKRARAMTKEQRLQLMLAAHSQKAITQMGEAQKKSFSGQADKLRDSFKQFIGLIGKPLFDTLKVSLTDLNAWLTKNDAKVKAFAQSVGGGLKDAFNAIVTAVRFLVKHGDETIAVLKGVAFALGIVIGKMIGGWIVFAAPIMFVAARVAFLFYIFEKLRDFLKNDLVAAVVTVIAGVMLFNIGRVTKAVWGMVTAWRAARAAAASTAAVGGAGAAVNAMGTGAMMLGPAGKGAPAGSPTVVGKGLGGGPQSSGGGGAGAANLLLPILAASIASAFIPTRQHSEAFLDDNGLYDVSKMKAFMGTNHGSEAIKQATAAVNNLQVQAPMVVNISGVGMSADELTQKLAELEEERQRFLQNAYSGGKR